MSAGPGSERAGSVGSPSEAHRAREARRAHPTLQRLVPVVAAAWAVFAVVNLATWRPISLGVCVAVAAITMGLWAAGRARPLAWRSLLHLTLAVSVVAIVANSWSAGSIRATGWWFLPAAPLFAAHVGGRREAWIWAVGSVLALLAACFLSPFPTEFVPTFYDRVLAGLVLVMICTTFGVLARGAADTHLAEIEEAARARAELLATIGHEVRTPLHGMVGTAAILADSELGPEQRELLRTLQASGQALRKIVDDVLDVARLDAGQLRIEPHAVDLMSVVEDVVDLFGSDAGAKNLGLALVVEGAEHLFVEADGNRVRQIVANLVGNAVKFTEEGHVCVRVAAGPATGDPAEGGRARIRIAVEDTGPGVPDAKLDALFEAFGQPDRALARLHGGSGLGLALSRHLAERMGGTLRAEPGRARGACFELALEAPRLEAPATRSKHGEGSLLVLEQDPLLAEAALSTARALAVPATVASSLAEARAAIVAARPALVIVSGASEADPDAARVSLREALGADRPIVLAVPQDRVGSYLATEVARSFDGSTLVPLRRARLRALLEEASLQQTSRPTPLLVGKALVLDDDPTSRRLMSVMLERRGFAVAAFARGAEALEELAKDRFVVVTCDLNMPELDGIEVIRAARALSTTEDTTFLVASASARDEDRRRCLDAGFAGYLTKPFEPAQLDELLARARRRATLPPGLEAPGLGAPGVGATVPEEPALDAQILARLRELLGEETDALLADLHRSTDEHLTRIEEAPEDEKEVQRAAHTIASSTLQAGLTTLGERARALELSVAGRSRESILEEAGVLRGLRERAFAELGFGAASSSAPPAKERRVASMRFSGHLDERSVERELARLARTSPRAPRVLVDCAAMSSYEPDARHAFERWASRSQSLEAIAFVTRNRLWGAVVRAMATASGKRMRSFWSVTEAEAWLSGDLG